MYNNHNRRYSIRNLLLFVFVMWTLWLGFIWFANQGELVITNHKYLDAKFKLDSVNMQQQKYTQIISELEEDLQDIQGSMKRSEVKLNRISNLYLIEKSKNDTIINENGKDNN